MPMMPIRTADMANIIRDLPDLPTGAIAMPDIARSELSTRKPHESNGLWRTAARDCTSDRRAGHDGPNDRFVGGIAHSS